jgi:CheY-like chemotaxis protein
MKAENGKRVLVVDNDETILWSTQALLEEEGFDTRTTWSGHEALALLEKGDFDILLVDDYLPDLHASDFLERVSRLPMQPWVVVMRWNASKPGELRRYESLGASAVVDKRDPAEIRKAVASQTAPEPLARTIH